MFKILVLQLSATLFQNITKLNPKPLLRVEKMPFHLFHTIFVTIWYTMKWRKARACKQNSSLLCALRSQLKGFKVGPEHYYLFVSTVVQQKTII